MFNRRFRHRHEQLSQLPPTLLTMADAEHGSEHSRARGVSRLAGAPFVVDGGHIAERGVTAPGWYRALDELEDGHAGLGLGAELAPVEQFARASRRSSRTGHCRRRHRPIPSTAALLRPPCIADRSRWRCIAIPGRPSICQAATRVWLIELAALTAKAARPHSATRVPI